MMVVEQILTTLKETMRAKKITHQRIADETSLTRQTVAKHLNNGEITLNELIKTCNLLGIEITLEDKGEKEKMEPWLFAKLKENNMKQRQLAELLEIEEGTLSKKFNGVLPFTYSEVVLICEVLHIDNPLPYFPKKRK